MEISEQDIEDFIKVACEAVGETENLEEHRQNPVIRWAAKKAIFLYARVLREQDKDRTLFE